MNNLANDQHVLSDKVGKYMSDEERYIYENRNCYSCFTVLGRGLFSRKEFDNLDEALIHCRSTPRTALYAAIKDGDKIQTVSINL